MSRDFLIEELKEYIGFGDDDAARLKELRPLVAPYMPQVVENFYEAFSANPRTLAIFTDAQQIERLKKSFEGWLDEVFSGIYDGAYFARRQRIGQVHVKVGLLPHFMFAAINLVRCDLAEILDEIKPERPYRNSVQKILDIELTIMVQSYCDRMMDLKMQIPAAIAAGLAHEIRNPLNAIGLQLTLLERRLRKLDHQPEAMGTSIESIRSELRRMRGLTSEILDFTKPVIINPNWHRSDRLLQGLTKIYGPTLEASQITLKTCVTGAAEMYCDADRLIQVLVNLLKNSVEALDNDGQISIALENRESLTLLLFKDNGPGFPEDIRFKAFDLFFTTKATGTGMGLPIIQKIIEAHGGTIKLEPQNNQQGSTFLIVLPRPPRQEDPSRKPRRE